MCGLAVTQWQEMGQGRDIAVVARAPAHVILLSAISGDLRMQSMSEE